MSEKTKTVEEMEVMIEQYFGAMSIDALKEIAKESEIILPSKYSKPKIVDAIINYEVLGAATELRLDELNETNSPSMEVLHFICIKLGLIDKPESED